MRVSKNSAKILANERNSLGVGLSRYSRNSTIAALPHLVEIMKETDEDSDAEGKAAMGSERVSMKLAGSATWNVKPRWVAASELGNE